MSQRGGQGPSGRSTDLGFILKEQGSHEETGKGMVLANCFCEALKVSMFYSAGHILSAATLQLRESSRRQYVDE